MRTLDARIVNGLKSGSANMYKRFYLYRRVFSAGAYSFDTAIEISDYFADMDPIKFKLDTETYGVFNISNVTLTFNNSKNKFKQDNTYGFFPSKTTGLLQGSKIVIQAGVMLDDGTEVGIAVFTGYIKDTPSYDAENGTVDLVLSGQMSIFDDYLSEASPNGYNAELISTLVTSELAGSDSGTEFLTANSAAGIIISVKKGLTSAGASAATELVVSKEYSVSQLNEYAAGAKITLDEALLSGYSLWITYRYWYTDKPLEWLVAQICALCGITSTAISPAAFESDIKNTWTQATAAEFDDGTDFYTDHSSGDVLLSSGFPAATAYSWAAVENTNISWDLRPTMPEYYTGAERVSAAPILPQYNPDKTARWASSRAASASAYGTWQFDCDAGALYGIGTVPHYFHFISDTGTRGTTTGYCLLVDFYSPATNTLRFTLYRANSGTLTQLWSTTYNATRQPWGAAFVSLRFRISRDSAGLFRLYVMHGASGQWTSFDGIATDNSVTTSAYVIAAFSFPAWDMTYPTGTFQAIAYDAQAATGTGLYWPSGVYTSPVIDSTATLKAWGEITASISSPSGTASVLQLRHSADNSTWSAWVDAEGSGAILTTDRYIQLRLLLYGSTAQDATPTMTDWNVTYYTSQTLLRVVDMTGLTCSDALKSLAEMCAYEIGFDLSDTFIFRPRSSSNLSVLTMDGDYVSEIVSLDDGRDKVKNVIKVTFGDYARTADSTTEGDVSPTSQEKYGSIILTISNGNFVPAEGVDLAYAIAPTVWAYTSKCRKRATVKTKFAMNLELGDAVTLNCPEPSILKQWKWGDTDVVYGQSDIVYWSEEMATALLSLYNIIMRVEGIEWDMMTWTTTFNLTEVVQ